MKNVNLLIYIFLIPLLLCSCNKGEKIVVDDITQMCDNSMFRGAEPDITFDQLCERVGEPNEYLDKGEGEDREHSPIYYFDNGKIICHWGGSKREDIGMIEFIPFENKPMNINSILKVPLSEYDITAKTEKIRLFQGDMLFYVVYLDNLKVKKIDYWLVKKKFLNVAW